MNVLYQGIKHVLVVWSSVMALGLNWLRLALWAEPGAHVNPFQLLWKPHHTWHPPWALSNACHTWCLYQSVWDLHHTWPYSHHMWVGSRLPGTVYVQCRSQTSCQAACNVVIRPAARSYMYCVCLKVAGLKSIQYAAHTLTGLRCLWHPFQLFWESALHTVHTPAHVGYTLHVVWIPEWAGVGTVSAESGTGATRSKFHGSVGLI